MKFIAVYLGSVAILVAAVAACEEQHRRTIIAEAWETPPIPVTNAAAVAAALSTARSFRLIVTSVDEGGALCRGYVAADHSLDAPPPVSRHGSKLSTPPRLAAEIEIQEVRVLGLTRKIGPGDGWRGLLYECAVTSPAAPGKRYIPVFATSPELAASFGG